MPINIIQIGSEFAFTTANILYTNSRYFAKKCNLTRYKLELAMRARYNATIRCENFYFSNMQIAMAAKYWLLSNIEKIEKIA